MDKILKTNLWVEKYKKLIQYIKNNNGKYPKSENSLSIWINTQRQNYKKGILLKEREEKLNEIGFIWEVDNQEIWNENFIQLKEYLLNNNEKYPNRKKNSLGSWVAVQRENKKKGKLSIERIEKLNEINFIWEVDLNLWNQNFNQLKEYFKNNNNEYPNIKTSLGRWIKKQRQEEKKGILSKEKENKLNEINFIWGISLDEQWNRNFNKLKEYLLNNNGKYPKSENSLGIWASTQRQNYKKGILLKEREEKLNDIGFIWDIDLEEKWNEKFLQLKEYIKEHSEYPKFDSTMGIWVNNQRQRYKKGKLSKEKQDKLNEIGFIWEIDLDEKWNEKFLQLKEYIKEYSEYPEITTSLGNWIQKQRQDNKKGKLSKEKENKLNEINFVWEINLEEKWNEKFLQLKIFFENNTYPRSGTSLNNWMLRQRQHNKKGILSKERKDKLNEIGFIWDIDLEEKWNENFLQLKEYLKNNNGEYPKEIKNSLGVWVSTQRQNYKKGILLKEREEKLNEIGFIWDVDLEEQWNEKFLQLKILFENNNHPKYGTSLNNWMLNQRQHNKKGILSKERKDKLNEIGFAWEVDLDEKWNKKFLQLKEYIKEHSEYPNPTTPLNIWILTQRYLYKKGKLSKEKENKLNEIGFIWEFNFEEKWNEIWNKKFLQLKEYIKEHSEYPKSGTSLNIWVLRQRRYNKKGKLSKEKENKLNEIGFIWEINLEEKWNENFLQLKILLENNNYPKYGTSLCNWMLRQRQDNKKGTLPKERKDKLNEIGFAWETDFDGQWNKIWNEKFLQLKEYIKEHSKYPEFNTPLGNWIQKQRKEKKKGILSKEKQEKLNEIGFIWEINLEEKWNEKWNEKFLQLKEYLKKHSEYPKFGTTLNNWVTIQRQNYKKGILSKERKDKLNEIGFSWGNISEKIWEKTLDQLIEYIINNNHQYPEKNEEFLYNWVLVQRNEKEKQILSKERIDKLDAIGFLWSVRE